MLPQIDSDQHDLFYIVHEISGIYFKPLPQSVKLPAMRTLLTTLHSKYIHPSLALPYLASFCSAKKCGELSITEFTTHEPRENIIAEIMRHQADVIAFSVYIWNRTATLDVIDALFAINPQQRIVLGGPEVSFEQDDQIWQDHPGITAIIRGEGEQPLHDLLQQWQTQQEIGPINRVSQRHNKQILHGNDSAPLADLDTIPSPFTNGLMDCSRGFVYYETSRGCPYRCAFCMSALDDQVRSFSQERIERDLLWLLNNEVGKIKLVDRTFNYNPKRALKLFKFILKHNRSSHIHFEIGAHLLNEETLAFLEQVPEDMFQFEVGVQSVLPATLERIQRNAPLELLETNVRFLLNRTKIHLHLDLIAGLPGETFAQMLSGIDHVMNMNPQHLQIETVKLLPGAPLRLQADELGLKFDPNPPYRTLRTPDMDFTDLERVRGISRLLDITWNSNRGKRFIVQLKQHYGTMAKGLAALENFWQQQGLLRFPLSQKEIYENLALFIQYAIPAQFQEMTTEALCRDYALSERIIPTKAPSFFNVDLTETEQLWVKQNVTEKREEIKGQGIKLQFFAAWFHCSTNNNLPQSRRVHLFLYLTATAKKMCTSERIINSAELPSLNAADKRKPLQSDQ